MYDSDVLVLMNSYAFLYSTR